MTIYLQMFESSGNFIDIILSNHKVTIKTYIIFFYYFRLFLLTERKNPIRNLIIHKIMSAEIIDNLTNYQNHFNHATSTRNYSRELYITSEVISGRFSVPYVNARKLRIFINEVRGHRVNVTNYRIKQVEELPKFIFEEKPIIRLISHGHVIDRPPFEKIRGESKRSGIQFQLVRLGIVEVVDLITQVGKHQVHTSQFSLDSFLGQTLLRRIIALVDVHDDLREPTDDVAEVAV